MPDLDHAYPPDLAAHVLQRWPADAPVPAAALLNEMLTTAYHASFLRDEERPVTFRLIAIDPQSIADDAGPPTGLHRMRFSGSRKFDEHELRRLSPAVEYHRALIGVHLEDGRPCVWGFAQSGPRWLQVARGGRAVDVPLPPVIVVRVARPGQVAVACGAQPIAQLHNGRLIDLTLDVFDSSWLPARFAEVRGELTTLHAIANPDAAPVDPQLVQVLAQHMVKRTIATVRASHHGGTILILPVACEAAGADGAHILRMKYDFADEPPRRRYRTLLLAILAQIAKLASNIATKEAGWEEYQTASSAALGELDEALFELSVTIAALAEVDGAVVLDKRFELLGFGAEIGGDLPVVELVARALDLEGTERVMEPIDDVGTRHRSAYRFCARYKDALAIVVSQDGNVRFIAWQSGAVTYWDHSISDE